MYMCVCVCVCVQFTIEFTTQFTIEDIFSILVFLLIADITINIEMQKIKYKSISLIKISQSRHSNCTKYYIVFVFKHVVISSVMRAISQQYQPWYFLPEMYNNVRKVAIMPNLFE